MEMIDGLLRPTLMQRFPSRTAASSFGDWVANHAGLEQVLGVAGWLAPEFVEIEGHVFWDRESVGVLGPERSLTTPFGNDSKTIERYGNLLNLVEFFLAAADAAVAVPELVDAYGEVLTHFWGMALKLKFPDRRYCFAVESDLYDEMGPCFTFWQSREGCGQSSLGR